MLLLFVKLYALLAFVSLVMVFFVAGMIRLFGGNSDTGWGGDLRLLAGMLVSGTLALANAAVIALVISGAVAGASIWTIILAHIGGFLLSYLGFVVITLIYQGSAYQMVALLLGQLGYIVFAIWPRAAAFLFAWLLALLS